MASFPFLLLSALPALSAVPASTEGREPDHGPSGYAQVFADEFDGPTINRSAWRFDTSRNATGWYNQEKQYYADGRPENARIEHGNLIIEARAETLGRDLHPDWGGQKFTSVRMITQGLKTWTYGFFEIRAKVPCGRGTWPAIWMLPEDPKATWPDGGEIDIMEHVGFEPTTIHQTIHTGEFNFSNGTQLTKSFEVRDACTAMHRYQLLWTPGFIVTGMDDQPQYMVRRVKNDRSRWPFDRPMHLLLNIAVGGTWGGQKGIDQAAFPARMEVDYVRVYQPVATKG